MEFEIIQNAISIIHSACWTLVITSLLNLLMNKNEKENNCKWEKCRAFEKLVILSCEQCENEYCEMDSAQNIL